jgi:hypothetical protein
MVGALEVAAIMLRFWKLWWIGRRNLSVLWLALHHPRRPAWLLPALAILVPYSLEPPIDARSLKPG